jgi:hypothetical protein
VVGGEHDGQAVDRHLDRAPQRRLGQQLAAVAAAQDRAGQAHADAVGRRRDGVRLPLQPGE